MWTPFAQRKILNTNEHNPWYCLCNKATIERRGAKRLTLHYILTLSKNFNNLHYNGIFSIHCTAHTVAADACKTKTLTITLNRNEKMFIMLMFKCL